MNTYLYNLARDILLTEKNGISKVRFAKMLYFVHKGLVQKGQVASDALEFIRMPLGPVPVGFLELHTRPDIATYETSNGGLVYNTQMYTLRNQNIQPSEYVDTIVEILAQLRPFATSQLVEISHKEPSWQQKRNGEEYIITDADLENPLPVETAHKISEEIEEQRLQAHLVEGMLDDIVEESTSLEYPQS